MTTPTGWQPMDSCPRDKEVTLWATEFPTGDSCREIRGYFHEPLGWVAASNDGQNFTILYPQAWLPV